MLTQLALYLDTSCHTLFKLRCIVLNVLGFAIWIDCCGDMTWERLNGEAWWAHQVARSFNVFRGDQYLALYQLFLCVCGVCVWVICQDTKIPSSHTVWIYVVGLARENITTTTTPKAIAAFPLHISSVSNWLEILKVKVFFCASG